MAKKIKTKSLKADPNHPKAIDPFKIKYTLIDTDPVDRPGANPPGYKYIRASWKDRITGKERIGVVILKEEEVAALKKK